MTREEKLARQREAQARYKDKHSNRVRERNLKYKRKHRAALKVKKKLWHNETEAGKINKFMQYNLRHNYKLHWWILRYLDNVCELRNKKAWRSAVNRVINQSRRLART